MSARLAIIAQPRASSLARGFVPFGLKRFFQGVC
jgi:hypothetical protein